jgi:hypothetical protein
MLKNELVEGLPNSFDIVLVLFVTVTHDFFQLRTIQRLVNTYDVVFNS